MTSTELKHLCSNVNELSKEITSFLLKEVGNVNAADIQEKGLHDFVSYVDRASEVLIVKGLVSLIPDAGFITEEGTVEAEDKFYKWIIASQFFNCSLYFFFINVRAGTNFRV